MAYKRNVEIFEEAYEKKDAKSVVSYVARDGRRRYIAGNKNPDGGGNMPSGGMTEVTWQELKDKRGNGELTAGTLYRITDYQCTTTQENTRSAGHQFDIVLLALSENKLAEEGWAMMHDNIYDVTFADGVTKKCYIYHTTDEDDVPIINIVDIETKLGIHCSYIEGDSGNLVTIDENTKTASSEEYDSIDLYEENLTYNYFQNSNLSAWKVWYCLDNDKSRFAWADDSVDEDVPAYITYTIEGKGGVEEIHTLMRKSSVDTENLYAWEEVGGSALYTTSPTPSVGDIIYYGDGVSTKLTVSSFTPAQEGTGLPNGRGVIYRLIDEWCNDVGYDFKNIQQRLPLVNEIEYDEEEGVDTWVYTLDVYDLINQIHLDASIDGNKMQDLDEELVYGVACNLIEPSYTHSSNNPIQCIGYTAMITSTNDEGSFFGLKSNSIKSYIGNNPPIYILTNCNRCTIFEGSYMAILIQCSNVVLCNGCSSLREENHTMVYKISNQSNKWFIMTQNEQLTSLATMLDLDNL